MLEHHRVKGLARLDELGLRKPLRVEKVDLPLGSQPAAVGPERHQRVVRLARFIRGLHHARHRRDAVVTGDGGKLAADGAVQWLGHGRESGVTFFLT